MYQGDRGTRVEKQTAQSGKKKLKKFQKTLDKLLQVCYNKRVVRNGGAHRTKLHNKNFNLKGDCYYGKGKKGYKERKLHNH